MSLNVVRRLLPDFGTTYGPPGEGPFPGVVVLHGSEGGMSGWSHRTAAILAASGVLSHPHAYSVGGNGWNAGSIRDVELYRTVEALRALRASEPCNGTTGIYGISRGGEHALMVATLMARDGESDGPDCVAVHAAADVVCGAFDARPWRDPGDPGWRAWDPSERAWTWKGRSDDILPTTTIEVERYRGPLFASCGADDRVWSAEMTTRMAARREDHGLATEVHLFPFEGHTLRSAAENEQLSRLVAFLRAHLDRGGLNQAARMATSPSDR